MARNDEGEFELVLGNRQLLSVFFIVVVLLGVFFTMGYIVGRNTVPQFADQRNPVEVARQNPMVVEPAGGASTPAPVKQPDPAPAPPVETKRPEVKQPPPVKPPETKTPEVKKAPEKKPVETKVTPPKPPVETPKPAPVSASAGSPAAGSTFLQIAATKKNEADLLVEVLGKKGFRATTAPVPGQALLRVLVGPLPADSIGKARTDLEAIGFKPMVRKF